jgi:hypothetical protein
MPIEDIKDKATDLKDHADGLRDKTADLVGHVEEIADTLYKLTIINLTQKATNLVSAAVSVIIVITLGMFTVLFCGIAFSWWLGNVIDSRAGGFLLGALLFLLLTILIISFKKKIIFPYLRDLIIRKLYD